MIRWRFVGVALVMGATLLGCGPDVGESTVQPSWTVEVMPPSPTPTRTWTAQEQAAINAVHAYVAMWSKIAADPANEDADSIWRTAVDPEAEAALDLFGAWKSRGWHLVGEARFEPAYAVKGMIDKLGTRWEVTGCYVITGSYVVDSNGARIPDDDRIDRSLTTDEVLESPEGQYHVMSTKNVEGSC